MKAKAKPKAAVRTRPKAKPKPKALPRFRPKAKEGARRKDRRRAPEKSAENAWKDGEVVSCWDLNPGEIMPLDVIAVEEGSYMGAPVTAAGAASQLVRGEEGSMVMVKLRRTQSEELMRFHSGRAHGLLRVHLCPKDCDQEVMAEDYVHARQIRKIVDPKAEPGWVTCLEKVAEEPGVQDELKLLRDRAEGLGMPKTGNGEKEENNSSDNEGRQRKKKKKVKASLERGKGRASKKRKKIMGGKHPKAASTKDPQDLRGNRLGCKGEGSQEGGQTCRQIHEEEGTSSSSSSSSDQGSSSSLSGEEETIFTDSGKTRLVAEKFPGALSMEALTTMRRSILMELGAEDQEGKVKPVCTLYYRQQLTKKVEGALGRELLTIATAVDLLLKGRAASACDVLLQRMKSGELISQGTHWAVAQKVEVLPGETPLVSGREELHRAQRENFQDSKTTFLASAPLKGGGKETSGRTISTTGKETGKGTRDVPTRSRVRRGERAARTR